MMLDKKEDFYNNPDENFNRFREMQARIDVERRDKVILEQGVEKGRVEMIVSMHTDGIPLEQIARIGKVSVEKVKNILGIE